MAKKTVNSKMSRAGKKAWITRSVNGLEAKYEAEKSAGKRSAIRRQINVLKKTKV